MEGASGKVSQVKTRRKRRAHFHVAIRVGWVKRREVSLGYSVGWYEVHHCNKRKRRRDRGRRRRMRRGRERRRRMRMRMRMASWTMSTSLGEEESAD